MRRDCRATSKTINHVSYAVKMAISIAEVSHDVDYYDGWWGEFFQVTMVTRNAKAIILLSNK